MIIACISAYNDRGWIEGTIDSVKGIAGRIVVVDGAYKGFRLYKDNPASTDGTIELAERMGAEVIRTDKVWENQQEKRNKYFIGNDDDWYLIIDSDERLVINKEYFMPGGEVGYRIKLNPGVAMLRLFRHGVEYSGCHSALYYKGQYINPASCPLIIGMSIDHLKRHRSQERKQRKQEYYGNQYKYELEYRTKNGIP